MVEFRPELILLFGFGLMLLFGIMFLVSHLVHILERSTGARNKSPDKPQTNKDLADKRPTETEVRKVLDFFLAHSIIDAIGYNAFIMKALQYCKKDE